MYKRGVINEEQKKYYDKVPVKARVGQKSVRVKNVAEGKKLAKKLSKMFKVGGGSDFPIKVQQGPDVVVRREPVVKDKNKFNSGGIVNFKGVF